MSLLFRERGVSLSSLETLARQAGHPLRSASTAAVTADSALRSSAVWACVRLRADLISTTPLDVYRYAGGVQVEVPTPPVLVSPDGRGIEEWLWGTQADLDRYGNTFGIITERNGLGLPLRIELVPAAEVVVVVRDGVLDHYRIAGKRYQPDQVWHERQYTAAGLHVGLSPIAYAAWSIGTYLSAQEFASEWFDADAAPVGHLRNTLKPTIDRKDAEEAKARWKAAVANRDIFVTGRDWEYNMQAVDASTVMFLDTMKFGIADAARFMGVPGDMIDAESSTGSITYANVTQRNVQLLVINLGPAYVRRERALSKLTPAPRFVKFATKALLRMDPQSASTMLGQQIQDRMIAPSEARALDNREPFTPEQLAEFDRLFGNPTKAAPVVKEAAAPVINVDARTDVRLPAIDARSDVTVQAPPVPEVHNNYEHVIDARSTVEPAVVNVDARSEVTVPERGVTVNVEPALPAEPVLTRKRIETDDKGRIVGVIEERA